jgi:hypothetical protein
MGRSPRDAKKGQHPRGAPSRDDAVDSGTVPTVPTRIPPAFDAHALDEESAVRERTPTLTDEQATEQARIASVLMQTRPPKGRASAPDAGEVIASVDAMGTLSEDEEMSLLRDALAPLSRVPSLAKSLTELGPLLEDPKTAYVLGFVDGVLPLETIIEVTGLPEVDTLRILERAVGHGVVVFLPAKDRC